ncbi:MAG: CDP-alcohol phosphatidyltransferase family protein [Bowdeniella nasicola]|nr:CDP-alcohol phosphatidyltransferase family protein [Bowdeniella nasicola]
MLGQHGRGLTSAVFTPLARALVRRGVSPDAVTITGTIVASLAALTLIGTGRLVAGSLVVGIVVFTDSVDGLMARLSGSSSPWGAFLDSTLDRVSDAALFSSFVLYYAAREGQVAVWGMYAALAAAVLGGIVPYARARAEASGYAAAVGIAERSDRLLISLIAALLTGLGLGQWILAAALTYLALAAAVTVGQRIHVVHRQAEGR